MKQKFIRDNFHVPSPFLPEKIFIPSSSWLWLISICLLLKGLPEEKKSKTKYLEKRNLHCIRLASKIVIGRMEQKWFYGANLKMKKIEWWAEFTSWNWRKLVKNIFRFFFFFFFSPIFSQKMRIAAIPNFFSLQHYSIDMLR